MFNMSSLDRFYLCALSIIAVTAAFPDQGKWNFTLGSEHGAAVPKSLYKRSQIYLQISCKSEQPELSVIVEWQLTQLPCWEELAHFGDALVEKSQLRGEPQSLDNRTVRVTGEYKCQDPIHLKYASVDTKTLLTVRLSEAGHDSKKGETSGTKQVYFVADSGKPVSGEETKERIKHEEKLASRSSKIPEMPLEASEKAISVKQLQNPHKLGGQTPLYTITADGIYRLMLFIDSTNPTVPFNASVHIEMLGTYGYLSAADWPLLPFYGAMCLVYIVLGLSWLIVSFCQWRDLLRVQFWIGGVILLGMLEKATFYAEYQSINSTGVSVKGAVLLAELVSCGKRMLARMLVIIVSLGFGIVKPRLGPMLHRVVGTGTLYFVLAAVESYLRIMHPKNDQTNQILVASIPLAVLDSAICWWIFTSLVQTTRTLRLRRNLVKLSLYRHFTNTLIFAVVSSIVFMLYSIKYHKLATCLTDWKELWVDEAYWHLLFSVLLLVIMVLWRPTNNNQRYAFTPLLDAPDDDDDEEEQFVNDSFGVKMRGLRSNSPRPKSCNNVDDALKWVEENIPSSMADSALPILDSDEEIMTTKFEVSKMQ